MALKRAYSDENAEENAKKLAEEINDFFFDVDGKPNRKNSNQSFSKFASPGARLNKPRMNIFDSNSKNIKSILKNKTGRNRKLRRQSVAPVYEESPIFKNMAYN